MKQVLSEQNAVIVGNDVNVIAHPTTIFTDDEINVIQFDKELLVENLTSKKIDETLIKISEIGIEPVIIQLYDEPRTTDSDSAVEKLIEKGTVILTFEK